jgi:hypothetical protein
VSGVLEGLLAMAGGKELFLAGQDAVRIGHSTAQRSSLIEPQQRGKGHLARSLELRDFQLERLQAKWVCFAEM